MTQGLHVHDVGRDTLIALRRLINIKLIVLFIIFKAQSILTTRLLDGNWVVLVDSLDLVRHLRAHITHCNVILFLLDGVSLSELPFVDLLAIMLNIEALSIKNVVDGLLISL